jgi:hypothetical protein
MPGSGRANEVEIIIPKEPVAAMKMDDKIPGVGTLQPEVNLSPMPHQSITWS